MTQFLEQVHLIIDPEFGDRLRDLPAKDHVWIVVTPTNKLAIDNSELNSRFASFSFFPIQEGKSLENLALDYIDTIEDHHGEYHQEASYSALNVVGLTLTKFLREELKKYDFIRFEITPDGFVCYKKRHT